VRAAAADRRVLRACFSFGVWAGGAELSEDAAGGRRSPAGSGSAHSQHFARLGLELASALILHVSSANHTALQLTHCLPQMAKGCM
jgi:hypothetical protein